MKDCGTFIEWISESVDGDAIARDAVNTDAFQTSCFDDADAQFNNERNVLR